MEMRQTTREQIIAAAYRVLTEQGYDATTIKSIAHEAGVAPGLLHYYFASKDELLVAVLKGISSSYTENMQKTIQQTPAQQLRDVGLSDALQRTLQQPETYRLRYEFFALGLRNPALLPAIRSLLAGGRSGISNVVNTIEEGQDRDTNALAGILLACFDGLALQKLVDPEFDIEAAYRILTKMTHPLLQDT